MRNLINIVLVLVLVTACGKQMPTPNSGEQMMQPTGENSLPIAENATFYMVKNGEKKIYMLGSDFDVQALTYIVTVGPSFGTLTGEGNDLTYKPNPGYVGTDRFIYQVTDGLASSNTAVIEIHVRE